MSDKLKAAQERRKAAAKKIQQLRDAFTANGDRWKDAAEEENWRSANTDHSAAHEEVTQLRAAADVHTRARQIQEQEERENHEPNPRSGRKPGHEDPAVRAGAKKAKPTDEVRALALQGWMRAHEGMKLQRSHREAMQRCKMTNPKYVDLRVSNSQQFKRLRSHARSLPTHLEAEERAERLQRALGNQTAAAGAVTVPAGFVAQFEIALLAYGPMLQVADILRTETGNELPWPTANDTGNEGSIVGEAQSVATQVDPSFGAMIMKAYKFKSGLVKCAFELLEDSAFDLMVFLAQALGERLGRGQNRKFTVGTGNSQPRGIVTASRLGKTTASSSAITMEEVREFFHSVDEVYRNGAAFMMHDTTACALRLLKGSDGHFYWWDDVSGEGPSKLMGRVAHINNHMDEIATGKKVMLFGQLSKYKIRQVGRLRMKRIVERYVEEDQEGFIGFQRSDGDLLDAGTGPVKHLKMA